MLNLVILGLFGRFLTRVRNLVSEIDAFLIPKPKITTIDLDVNGRWRTQVTIQNPTIRDFQRTIEETTGIVDAKFEDDFDIERDTHAFVW